MSLAVAIVAVALAGSRQHNINSMCKSFRGKTSNIVWVCVSSQLGRQSMYIILKIRYVKCTLKGITNRGWHFACKNDASVSLFQIILCDQLLERPPEMKVA